MRLLFALVLLGLPARAAPSDEEAAKVHFLSGQAYYDQANYEDALREFAEAYRILQKPALLYNLALCHERLDHYREAVDALKSYLARTPDATDRVQVEARIHNLEERQRRVAPSPQPVARPLPPPPAADSPRRRVATWVVGGLGLGLLAGALASGVVAELRFNALKSDCGGGFTCSLPDLESRKSAGSAAALATDVLWPLGTAAVITAVALYFVEGRPQKVHASAGGLAVTF